MDRFMLDDVEDAYDAVEPLRPSSFDMSFTLSTSGEGSYQDRHNPLHAVRTSEDTRARRRAGTGTGLTSISDSDVNRVDATPNDFSSSRSSTALRRTTMLYDQGRLQADERDGESAPAANDMGAGMRLKSGKRKNVTSIAEKLEEKAHEAILMANLMGNLSWRLSKRMQDVHVYKPSTVSDDDAGKVIFRVSCEVKASLHTIMEYLSPKDSKSYFDIESKVFPGLLHASVIKKMDIPKAEEQAQVDNSSPKTQSSSVDDPLARDFPRLQVKWHASRFAGRFVKPVDFFFVEYSNVDTLPDGRKRGYGYVRSVESFKGDELATRLNSEKVSIPTSVSKCKRAVINKGIYTVTPSSGTSANAYEIALMMVIDFQDQFSTAVGQRIIQNFTSRLVGIREQLYKTLFQPVSLATRTEWSQEKSCALCRSVFTFVKPRHHCRSCGEAVCGQCSRKWVVQPGGSHKDNQTRLCTSCSLQARSHLRPERHAGTMLFGSEAGSSPERSLESSHYGFSTGRLPTPPRSDPVQIPLGETSGFDYGLRSTVRLPPRTGDLALLPDALHSDVKVASVITTEADTAIAAAIAFDSLMKELGGVAPHLMMVTYSHLHDGHAIHRALADVAPDTLFMGGTSSGGVFTDAGSVDAGPVIGLWGIHDPEGSYTVLNADLNDETPRDATRRCLIAGMRLLCMEPEESPDFIWMHLSAGTEEQVVKAANEVVDCSFSIVAGGSYVVATNAPRFAATQICSEGGELGCVTTHGLCFAVCSPSVEVAHACFTCYEPKEKQFTVTKAVGREIQMLDHKPAFAALNDGCRGMLHEFVSDPARFDLEKTKLPLFYPLSRPRHESRTAKLSRFQVIQPFQALDDGALVVGCEVRAGEKLRMMSVAQDAVGDRVTLGFREALRSSIPVIESTNVVGCIVSVSSNYPAILNNESHVLALATARTFKNSSVLGAVSTGQQGVLLCTTEALHANAMMSSILITNRKKAVKLDPLKPVLLRRFSTY